MKKNEFMKRIFASTLAVFMLFAFFTSCQKDNKNNASSDMVSSEITSSDTATSEPEKDLETESSKPETPKNPETSSKPKTETSSKPKDNVSSKPKTELPIEIPVIKPNPKPTPKPEPTPTPEPTPKPTPEPTPEQKTDAELLIGKWVSTVDMAEGLKESGFEITETAIVSMTYEFTASNTVVTKLDEDKFRTVVRPAIEQMVTQIITTQYQMTVEEFEAESGMTFADLVTITIESAIEAASEISEYKLDKNGIYIKDTATGQYDLYTYEFKSDDELILTYDNIPKTFTRV